MYFSIQAGILTYAPGENVEKSLRQFQFSAPSPSVIDKFRQYNAPDLGTIRLHYGHYNDPKGYETMTHGVHSDSKSSVSKN